MSDALLMLGGVVFQDFEIPERIHGLGGEQMLVVNRLVGGQRVIDAMGPDEAERSWSGRFRGGDALARASAIDQMRKAGLPVALSFGSIDETVIIRRFTFDVLRFYEAPYEIALEVVSDDDDLQSGPGVDEMIGADSGLVGGLSDLIGDTPLAGLVGQMTTAVDAVGDFAAAGRSTLASVLAPVQAVQNRAEGLLSDLSARASSLTAFGGLL